MVLDLDGKIALITGGGCGIGLRCAKELLRNGVKAVTLADINPSVGETALAEIEKEFGSNRAIFMKTDVTDIQQFESAFKKTIEKFKYVDILVNNAGILNDVTWQKEILTNINGTIHGMLLGLENYLQRYRQGSEAVIVNFSSVAGIDVYPSFPIYCGTKGAIVAMTRSWGDPHHYDRTKVRVFAICPGATTTPMLTDINGKNLGEPYEDWLRQHISSVPTQEPEHVAQELVKLIQSCPSGTVWVADAANPAYQFIIPELASASK